MAKTTGSPDFLRLLDFDVVTEAIVGFLNFEDIKCLSRVSKTCLHSVRNTTCFVKKAMLKTCRASNFETDEAKHEISLAVLKETKHQWKNISFSLSDPEFVMAAISMDILKHATFLLLRRTGQKSKLIDESMVFLVSEIFKNAPKLKQLRFSLDLLAPNLHGLFDLEGVKKVFDGLHELDLFSQGLNETENDRDMIQSNLIDLFKMPMKLQRFLFGWYDFMEPLLKPINNFVASMKATLEELKLDSNTWNFMPCELQTICLPNLKRLTVYQNQNENFGLAEFLKCQPPLEELCISVPLRCAITMLNSLHQNGLLCKIKKLEISVKPPSSQVSDVEPINWGMLASMHQLKELSLVKQSVYYSSVINTDQIYGSGERIISKLPCGIEKFFVDWNVIWQTPEHDLGNLFQRFTNLSKLSLYGDNDAVDDTGFQALIRKCKQLTLLKLINCPQLTDSGITGLQKSARGKILKDSGASIADFKGLIHLGISFCSNISPKCLLKVVNFRFLRNFDYSGEVQFQKGLLLDMVRRNRCLETIMVSIKSGVCVTQNLDHVKREIVEISPRINSIHLWGPVGWEEKVRR